MPLCPCVSVQFWRSIACPCLNSAWKSRATCENGERVTRAETAKGGPQDQDTRELVQHCSVNCHDRLKMDFDADRLQCELHGRSEEAAHTNTTSYPCNACSSLFFLKRRRYILAVGSYEKINFNDN
jgi:hypothetical protein